MKTLQGFLVLFHFLTVDVNRNVLFREFQCQEKKERQAQGRLDAVDSSQL